MCRKGRFVSEDQHWSCVSMTCPFQEHYGLPSSSHCALRSPSLYGTRSDPLALQDFPGQIAETLLLHQRVMGVHQTFVAAFPLLNPCLFWFCLYHAPTLFLLFGIGYGSFPSCNGILSTKDAGVLISGSSSKSTFVGRYIEAVVDW